MKVYVKPELEEILFATEVVTTVDTEGVYGGYDPDVEVT